MQRFLALQKRTYKYLDYLDTWLVDAMHSDDVALRTFAKEVDVLFEKYLLKLVFKLPLDKFEILLTNISVYNLCLKNNSASLIYILNLIKNKEVPQVNDVLNEQNCNCEYCSM